MTHFCLSAFYGLFYLACVGIQTADIQDKLNTGRYVLSCQSKGGGFAPARPQAEGDALKPSLRATSAGLRALKYLGVKLPIDRESCVKLVEGCYEQASGGFAD